MFEGYYPPVNYYILSEEMSRLKIEGKITEPNYRTFLVYHESTLHKLKSVEYCLDEMRKLVSEIQEYPLDYFRAYTSVATKTSEFSATPIVEEERDTRFLVDFHAETFFEKAFSARDILAHEINIFYPCFSNEQDISLETIQKELSTRYPQKRITKYLNISREKEKWQRELDQYRACSVHRRILSKEMSVSSETFTFTGSTTPKLEIYLCDHPLRTGGATFRKKRQLVNYCRSIFVDLLKFVDEIYGIVKNELNKREKVPIVLNEK